MPRLGEAKKDVLDCEKPRGAVKERRYVGIRMGQPTLWRHRVSREGGEPREVKHLST